MPFGFASIENYLCAVWGSPIEMRLRHANREETTEKIKYQEM
jgi:hypothetical protein